jgi:hypothetical protein
MKPARQNPRNQNHVSHRELLSKGEAPMGRICLVAAAVIILTASWAVAGNFEVLAEAGVVKVPTPLHQAGTLVKAEFRSNLAAPSDIELENDTLLPEKISAKGDSKVVPKPAIAYRERSARGMAPPPRAQALPESRIGAAVEDREEASDLEDDLEKNLVIPPPPPKTLDRQEMETAPEPQKKIPYKGPGVTEKKADKKVEKKKAAPKATIKTPSEYDQFAAGSKPIRKVRPLSGNPWGVPAGNYENRCCPVNPQALMADPRRNAHRECAPTNNWRPETRQALTYPPTADRFVRDGVTIKLAPAAASPAQPFFDEEESNSDIFSSAAEILGLPFAFISSFF